MRLTSILALCVAATPVLAEQKYPAWMGNAMDFAQTTTGGEYDVDVSTPEEPFYWGGATVSAALTPQFSNSNELGGDLREEILDYYTVRLTTLAARQEELNEDLRQSLLFDRLRPTEKKQKNSTHIKSSDFGNTVLFDGDARKIAQTDKIHGFLWFNTLIATQDMNVDFTTVVKSSDKRSKYCVTKMIAAKNGFSDLLNATNPEMQEDLRVLRTSEIGVDLIVQGLGLKSSRREYPIGFIAMCDGGPIDGFDVIVEASDTGAQSGFKKQIIPGGKLLNTYPSGEPLTLNYGQVKTPINANFGPHAKYANGASNWFAQLANQQTLMLGNGGFSLPDVSKRPLLYRQWFTDLVDRAKLQGEFNFNYVDLKLEYDNYVEEMGFNEDFLFLETDVLTPNLLFRGVDIDLTLKTPIKGDYELLIVPHSNVVKTNTRVLPLIRILKKSNKQMLYYSAPEVHEDYREKLSKECLNSNLCDAKDQLAALYGLPNEEGMVSKSSRLVLHSSGNPQIALLITAYPYFHYENHGGFNEFGDFENSNPPDGAIVFSPNGYPESVAGDVTCSLMTPCVADKHNRIELANENHTPSEMGFSLYIKPPDEAYFRSITADDVILNTEGSN